jgi:hypothetical protein
MRFVTAPVVPSDKVIVADDAVCEALADELKFAYTPTDATAPNSAVDAIASTTRCWMVNRGRPRRGSTGGRTRALRRRRRSARPGSSSREGLAT